jgi:hypothetical protein
MDLPVSIMPPPPLQLVHVPLQVDGAAARRRLELPCRCVGPVKILLSLRRTPHSAAQKLSHGIQTHKTDQAAMMRLQITNQKLDFECSHSVVVGAGARRVIYARRRRGRGRDV